MDIQALLLTLRLAAVTTLILLGVALPFGYWLAFARSRLSQIAQSLSALPLVLPPTVLGFYLLVLLGPASAPGRLLARAFGHPLAFSFAGLVVGSVIYSFPFAVQPIAAGFASLDRDVIDAGSLLSASRMDLFQRVLLPLSRRSVITAAVLSFTHTVGEFGVVLMIGGSIPGRTRTLSVAMYDQVQDFAYGPANRTALLLLAFSLTALLVIYMREGTRA